MDYNQFELNYEAIRSSSLLTPVTSKLSIFPSILSLILSLIGTVNDDDDDDEFFFPKATDSTTCSCPLNT